MGWSTEPYPQWGGPPSPIRRGGSAAALETQQRGFSTNLGAMGPARKDLGLLGTADPMKQIA
jgi:hypothetical protein